MYYLYHPLWKQWWGASVQPAGLWVRDVRAAAGFPEYSQALAKIGTLPEQRLWICFLPTEFPAQLASLEPVVGPPGG